MLFTDLTFLYFHAIVVALRWWLPPRAAGPLLLVASYLFYLSAGPRYVALIFGATVFAWWVGLALSRATRPRALLGFAVAALLSMLAWFKYSAFAAQQVAALLHLPRPGFTVALPLAISFFSFELISYVVDVHRGTAPERSLWRFALYVSYYPHLIAGPIVRAEELLPSLRAPKPFDDARFGDGVYILLIGFLKKTVLADRMAPWADAVFSDPSAHGTLGVWMGVLAYTGQIYCDFSGYTDIARGASLTLGLPLPENFDWPYLSTSITEFWRRWHMTLSRWLRDYLYIGLGGNRGGPLRQYRNLLLTMLLGGLWHGANWTFVAWGALHGLALCAHKLWDTALRGFPVAQRFRASRPYRVLAWAATLLTVAAAWVLFRAPTFARAWSVLLRLTHDVAGVGALGTPTPAAMRSAEYALLALAVGHLLALRGVGWAVHRALPPIARGLYWALIILVCFVFAETRATFIYFQF